MCQYLVCVRDAANPPKDAPRDEVDAALRAAAHVPQSMLDPDKPVQPKGKTGGWVYRLIKDFAYYECEAATEAAVSWF